MKLKIYIDTRNPNINGEYPIRISINRDGARFYVTTGLNTPIKFDGMVFPKSVPNAVTKTNALNRLYIRVESFCLNNTHLSLKDLKIKLKEELTGREVVQKKKTLHDFCIEVMNLREKKGTRNTYKLLCERIADFDKDAPINVNTEWVSNFERYLLNSGLKRNTASLRLSSLKTVFTYIRKKGFIIRNPMEDYVIRTEQVMIRDLTIKQIRKLRDMPLVGEKEKCRDIFMLMFYLAGINIGDLLLCKGLKNGRLAFVRRKTDKANKAKRTIIDLPVYPEAMAIINRYKGEEYLLNILSAKVSVGSFLSALCRTMNALKDDDDNPLFDFRISSNVARYSFASIASELSIPREHIAMCLGHSWSDVSSHYIHYKRKIIDDTVRTVLDAIKGDY